MTSTERCRIPAHGGIKARISGRRARYDALTEAGERITALAQTKKGGAKAIERAGQLGVTGQRTADGKGG